MDVYPSRAARRTLEDQDLGGSKTESRAQRTLRMRGPKQRSVLQLRTTRALRLELSRLTNLIDWEPEEEQAKRCQPRAVSTTNRQVKSKKDLLICQCRDLCLLVPAVSQADSDNTDSRAATCAFVSLELRVLHHIMRLSV
jgi:hypothetical protein